MFYASRCESTSGCRKARQGTDIPPAPRPAIVQSGEYLVAAPPGRYFVAGELSTGDDGTGVLGYRKYKGYTKRLLGLPRYFDVEAGMVTDARTYTVRLAIGD